MFLRIYKARKGYRPRAKFSTWLFTIANNLALNHLRGKGRNPSVPARRRRQPARRPSRRSGKQLEGREGTPSAQMRKVELSEVVREALDVLSEDQKMAVLLNKFEDMSYAEIAEVMGRSPAAIKSLLARARNQLREQLEPYLLTGELGLHALHECVAHTTELVWRCARRARNAREPSSKNRWRNRRATATLDSSEPIS